MKISNGLPYVVIRGDRSGVFVGFLKNQTGNQVTILESRRLFYWDGAASISQIALQGVSKPQNCKFPEQVPEHQILDVIEIIPCSSEAYENIKKVPVWKT